MSQSERVIESGIIALRWAEDYEQYYRHALWKFSDSQSSS